MIKIKMLTGHEIPLDGDLLYLLESLYREVSLKRELKATFDEMMNEIQNVVDGMDEAARKQYLVESIFLNTVTYENERLSAYIKKLTAQSADEGESV